jgi:triphosphoribosyl-dephospho-CoA synthase
LADGIKAELYLTPKPGLVDLRDVGSHPDLSLLQMSRSAVLLQKYLTELALALYQQQSLAELQSIGRRAEQRMLTELGSNCHRGGIFLSGLLLSAYAECASDDPETLSNSVAILAQRYFQQTNLTDTHGQLARSRYRTGGIVAECLNGLPGLFQVALPSMLGNGADFPAGCYLAMARLMKVCDDTTCLHRGGQPGLARLRRAGSELEQCLLLGDDPVPLLLRLNDDFRATNLTMGGVADLLGLTFGYLNFCISRFGFAAIDSVNWDTAGR